MGRRATGLPLLVERFAHLTDAEKLALVACQTLAKTVEYSEEAEILEGKTDRVSIGLMNRAQGMSDAYAAVYNLVEQLIGSGEFHANERGLHEDNPRCESTAT